MKRNIIFILNLIVIILNSFLMGARLVCKEYKYFWIYLILTIAWSVMCFFDYKEK